METLGYRIPDPRFSFLQMRSGLIRHAAERYNPDHAYFGSAFVLVVLPSMLVVLFSRRLCRWQRCYLGAAIFTGVTYFVTIGLVNRYIFHDGRWLIEMVILLTVVAPAIFFVLPRRVAVTGVILVSGIAIAEMNDTIHHNRAMPSDLVTRVPRGEQYYQFFGTYDRSLVKAIRTLNINYPLSEYKEVFVSGFGPPPPLYSYMSINGGRRVTQWSPDENNLELPGLVVTRDLEFVKQISKSPNVHVERLSMDDWALISKDRLRVYVEFRRHPFEPSEDALLLKAVVDPKQYQFPMFKFVLLDSSDETPVSNNQADPYFEIPIERLARSSIKVEAREKGEEKVRERYLISPERYNEL